MSKEQAFKPGDKVLVEALIESCGRERARVSFQATILKDRAEAHVVLSTVHPLPALSSPLLEQRELVERLRREADGLHRRLGGVTGSKAHPAVALLDTAAAELESLGAALSRATEGK